MTRKRRLSVTILALLVACGGDPTGTGAGADVKIISVSANVSVENIGGAGDFYLEFWGWRYLNPPTGTPNSVIHITSSAPVAVTAGYHGTVGIAATSTRIVAKSRSTGGSGYYTSDCYGSGC